MKGKNSKNNPGGKKNNPGGKKASADSYIGNAGAPAAKKNLPYTDLSRACPKDKTMSERNPWDIYPRPQMKRESFISLNGNWEFVMPGRHRGSVDKYKISVPFVPQSELSNVNRGIPVQDTVIYSRKFELSKQENKRVILHFGAVDRVCRVSVNSHMAITHIGGYTPFRCDITEYLDPQNSENVIMLEVEDDCSSDYPYGKQKIRRGGMWYTAVSGIWQSVWIEEVPMSYVENIRISTCKENVSMKIFGGELKKTVTVSMPWGSSKFSFEGDEFTFALPDAKFWSPDEPYLYNYILECGEDSISGYFALRDIEILNGKIYINGKPMFLHALLDQGYYPKGIFLPETPQGYESDILLAKKMGFNTLRKHLKIEPLYFYYLCDKLGMFVMQDCVENGKYSFLCDTVLPVIGFRRLPRRKRSKIQTDAFISQMKEMAELLYNSPSVIYYTIFNEGWGQFSEQYADAYSILKEICGNRIIDTASGWIKRGESDVVSDHIYFGSYDKIEYSEDKPNILSEYGGITLKTEGHTYGKKRYGYGASADAAEFAAKIEKLYTEKLIPQIRKGLSGAVMTQLNDVEDELNGLVSYDREVVKIDSDLMKSLSDEIYNTFNQTVRKKKGKNQK